MIKRSVLGVAVVWAVVAALPAAAQDAGVFQSRDGYDEKTLGTLEVEVATAAGPKTVRLSLVKLRIVGGQRDVAVALPERGLALVQHRAGEAEVAFGRDSFAPLEGEWMRLPLPGRMSVSTAADSALMDVILIEE